MEKVLFRGRSFSRMMLGTVQLGLDYGIANRGGRPSWEEARAIIGGAVAGGVNCFDTAAAYGGSEAVLGRAFALLNLAGKVLVTGKIRPLAPGLTTAGAAREVRASLRQSLERLRLERLAVCLMHREENACYLPALQEMKAAGLVESVGLSVYNPEAALAVLREGMVDALQVPASILDHRFRRAGVFDAARAAGVAVFVRSVYLQGLLLMPEAEIPAALATILPTRRRLGETARAAGLTAAELAVRYILGLPGATSVLVGVETAAQLKENLALFRNGPLDAALVEELEGIVPDFPDQVLIPSLWPR